MKTIITIPIHSYVDLITNSSSELFVCSTDKTVEIVKKVVEELYGLWINNIKNSDRVHYSQVNQLWISVFREPEVAKYSFDWYGFPVALMDEYTKYHEDNFNRGRSYYYGPLKDGHENTAEYKRLLKKEREIRAELTEQAKLHGCNQICDLYEKDKDLYNALYKESDAKIDKVWEKWSKKKHNAERAMIAWYLQQNGVDPSELDCIPVATSRWGGFYAPDSMSQKARDLIGVFQMCESWAFNIKEGDILLSSASYNSVPYELFGAIESMLNAERRHLG